MTNSTIRYLLLKFKHFLSYFLLSLFQICISIYSLHLFFFLMQRVMWIIATTWRLSSFFLNFYILIYFSPTTSQLEQNLIEMILGWSSTFYMISVSFGNLTWLLGPIMVFDWLKFKKFSSLKPHMEWNCYSERVIVV